MIYFDSGLSAEVYTASEESGAEDSDEDIITDYLSPLDDNGNVDAATAAAAVAVAAAAVVVAGGGGGGGDSTGVIRLTGSVSVMDDPPSSYCKDTCSGSADTASAASAAEAAAAADGGIIPTISVTQHSPAASKAFYILGKSHFDIIRLIPTLG